MRTLGPALLVASAALVGGCTVASDIHRRVERDVWTAVQIGADANRGGADDGFGDRPSSFASILAEVVHQDCGYRLAEAGVGLAGVERKDALRRPLPRLFLDGLLELPIDDGKMDAYASGGLHLRVNLVQAFLWGNALTVADVRGAAGRQACAAAASQAVLSFLSDLLEVDAALRLREHGEATRLLAARAAGEAEALYKTGGLPAAQWYAWERRRDQTEMDARRSGAALQQARAAVARAYGGGATEPQLLAHAEAFVTRLLEEGEDRADLADVLAASPAVAQAALDLFLAEMAVVDARLRRLPTVSLDLAAGDIPLRSEAREEDGEIVPMVGVSLPLFDWGDIARSIEKARIRAGQARERMLRSVEQARLDLDAAQQALLLARAVLTDAERVRDAASRRWRETVVLLDAGAATVMDAHEVEWLRNEAEAAAEIARGEYRQSLLADRAARGELLDEPVRAALSIEKDQALP